MLFLFLSRPQVPSACVTYVAFVLQNICSNIVWVQRSGWFSLRCELLCILPSGSSQACNIKSKTIYNDKLRHSFERKQAKVAAAEGLCSTKCFYMLNGNRAPNFKPIGSKMKSISHAFPSLSANWRHFFDTLSFVQFMMYVVSPCGQLRFSSSSMKIFHFVWKCLRIKRENTGRGVAL